MSGNSKTIPALLVLALLPGCGGQASRIQRTWYDSEHGVRVSLQHDGTGTCEVFDEPTSADVLNARFTVSWRKSGRGVRLEMYCREVYDAGQECGDPGYEDFELDCELEKEMVKTEERENDELICVGPDGIYTFEAVI